MKTVKVCSSQGSLGKNIGCEKAPDLLMQDAESVEIVESNLEETNKNLENAEGDFFIGGDHSITYPLFKALVEKEENKDKEIGLLIFDAHVDASNDFLPATHEDFNKTLIEREILKQRI